jgi:hypothetical protein
MNQKIVIQGFTYCETKQEARVAAQISKSAKIGKRTNLRKIWRDKGSDGYWASQIAGADPKLSIKLIRQAKEKKPETELVA